MAVPSVTASQGQIAIGPGVLHTSTLNNVTQTLSLRLDAVKSFGSVDALSVRPEAGANWTFDNGLGLGATATYSGLGSTHQSVGVSGKASGRF